MSRRRIKRLLAQLEQIEAESDEDTAWALGLDHPPFEDADPAEPIERKDAILAIQAARVEWLVAAARAIATAMAPFA